VASTDIFFKRSDLVIGFIVLAALISQGIGPKSSNIDPREVQQPLVVPAGTVIPVTLISRVNSKNARDGDGIYGKTAFPITIDNTIVIPEGSHVRGKITAVKRPGRVTGKAELTLSFQTLILPSGTTIPIYSSLGGAGGSGKRKGEATVQGDASKREDAQTIGATATNGALIGVIADNGRGAAIGAAGGATVGTAAVLITRGKDLVLEPGTTIEIVLDRPIEL
jgi:type IV secretory pathway VirB10-like protein